MRKKQKLTAEEAYLSVRDTLHGICAGILKRYGGDIEELISESYEHFMYVYHRHDPSKGPLEADVQFRVYRRMVETVETNARNRRMHRIGELRDYEISVNDPSYFNVDEFLSKLQNETAQLVRLALEPTADVEHEFFDQCRMSGQGFPNWRQMMRVSLRQYLKDMNWSVNQIEKSFREVADALSGP